MSRALYAALLAPVALLSGCGGGVPLLYPARTLSLGDVRVSGGTSGTFLVGSLASDVASARAQVTPGAGPAPSAGDAAYAKGALVLAAAAPGMAPYVAARVGVGDRFETGATYTGREAHLDVRRSFDKGDTSLSIGLGLETPVYGDAYTGTLPQVDLSAVHGFGADVPILVGWQSAGQVYMVWGGIRGGWDHASVSSIAAEAEGRDTALSGDRVYGAGVVGIAAGFRHVHVAMELDAAYQAMSGTVGTASVSASGFSVAPAGALWLSF